MNSLPVHSLSFLETFWSFSSSSETFLAWFSYSLLGNERCERPSFVEGATNWSDSTYHILTVNIFHNEGYWVLSTSHKCSGYPWPRSGNKLSNASFSCAGGVLPHMCHGPTRRRRSPGDKRRAPLRGRGASGTRQRWRCPGGGASAGPARGQRGDSAGTPPGPEHMPAARARRSQWRRGRTWCQRGCRKGAEPRAVPALQTRRSQLRGGSGSGCAPAPGPAGRAALRTEGGRECPSHLVPVQLFLLPLGFFFSQWAPAGWGRSGGRSKLCPWAAAAASPLDCECVRWASTPASLQHQPALRLLQPPSPLLSSSKFRTVRCKGLVVIFFF